MTESRIDTSQRILPVANLKLQSMCRNHGRWEVIQNHPVTHLVALFFVCVANEIKRTKLMQTLFNAYGSINSRETIISIMERSYAYVYLHSLYMIESAIISSQSRWIDAPFQVDWCECYGPDECGALWAGPYWCSKPHSMYCIDSLQCVWTMFLSSATTHSALMNWLTISVP